MRIQKPADAARLIKTRRLEQGLTQQNLADAIGITRQSFARIEQGHGGASLETFLKIFSILGISLRGTPLEHESTAPGKSAGQGRATSSHASILRKLGDSASRLARQELFDSGAVTKSILRMNQSTLYSALREDTQEGGETNNGSDA